MIVGGNGKKEYDGKVKCNYKDELGDMKVDNGENRDNEVVAKKNYQKMS